MSLAFVRELPLELVKVETWNYGQFLYVKKNQPVDTCW